MEDVTRLIGAARAGDKVAESELFRVVYGDLRQIARRLLRGQGDGAPRATSLVHEAYMRLARHDALDVNDRAHFFALAARAMRQLSIDHARERGAAKRGGGQFALTLDKLELADPCASRDGDLLALDQGLERLREIDPFLEQLVEMRFFAGFELEEIAELVGRSTSSLKRDWRKARAFLLAQLGGAPG